MLIVVRPCMSASSVQKSIHCRINNSILDEITILELHFIIVTARVLWSVLVALSVIYAWYGETFSVNWYSVHYLVAFWFSINANWWIICYMNVLLLCCSEIPWPWMVADMLCCFDIITARTVDNSAQLRYYSIFYSAVLYANVVSVGWPLLC